MDETKNILQSKTFWASFAVLVMALLKTLHAVPAGLDEGEIADALYMVVMGVFAVSAIGGRVLATKQITILPPPPPTDGDPVVIPDGGVSDATGKSSPNGKLTKTFSALVLLCAMMGGVMACTGCSMFATPTPMNDQDRAIQQVTQAQMAYVAAVTTVGVMHANGSISDDAMIAIVPIEATVYAYLQAATAAAQAGKTVDAATQLQLFNDAIARLNAAYGGVPTTTP